MDVGNMNKNFRCYLFFLFLDNSKDHIAKMSDLAQINAQESHNRDTVQSEVPYPIYPQIPTTINSNKSNTQSGQTVLTIPKGLVKLDNELEKQHLLKMFPKKFIFTFSLIQLVCAALAVALEVCIYIIRTK